MKASFVENTMNHLKFCSCRMCKAGMHSSNRGEYTARHKAKQTLKTVDLDAEDVVVETIVSVGYTD